jgi:hypothetical protein
MSTDAVILELTERVERLAAMLKSANPTMEDLGNAFGIANGIALHQSAAIVCALAEKALIDPFKVADWADVFASLQGRSKDLFPGHHEAVIAGLKGFADVLRSMATKPPGGAQLRQ